MESVDSKEKTGDSHDAAGDLIATRPLDVSRVLMVGCGGFIGSHLMDRLLPIDAVDIVGWDPDGRKIEHHLGHPRLNYRARSLTEDKDWRDLEDDVSAADVVINLAAVCRPYEYINDPIAVIKANFIDCYRLVEICAAQGTWLVHFSTSEVYGRTIAGYLPNGSDDPRLFELDEDTTPMVMGPIANQRWTYATAKQLLERYVFAHHAEHGLPFTIVRPLNFFGPRMDFIPGRDGDGVPRVLASFITALLDGKPMQLVDGGTARRTIVSIHDAIDAVLLMLRKPTPAKNRIFNIGNRDNEVTIAELADLMRHTYAAISGDEAYRAHPIEAVSADEFYGAGYEDCDRRMPKIDNARDRLGWRPKIPLQDVLTETVRYYYELYGRS